MEEHTKGDIVNLECLSESYKNKTKPNNQTTLYFKVILFQGDILWTYEYISGTVNVLACLLRSVRYISEGLGKIGSCNCPLCLLYPLHLPARDAGSCGLPCQIESSGICVEGAASPCTHRNCQEV